MMRRLILIPVVAVLMALIPAGRAWASPAVTISPNQVAAGQNITITGSGFSPGSSVIINWCFDGPLPEFPIVDDSGNFTLTVQIPTNAPTGPTCIDLPSSSLRVNFTITGRGTPSATTTEVGSKAGWVRTQVGLKQGQKYALKATGSWTVDFRNFPRVGPVGYPRAIDKTIYQGCKVLTLPYARLLGRVGDGGTAFSIGNGGTFTATSPGTLFLRINDADPCLGDNDGSVFAEVRPGSPPAPPDLATLPDLLTSSELPACVLSMTALSLGLVEASGAALPAWSDAVRLLSTTGSLGTFLSKLGPDPYWKALLAVVVQPLNNCFVGVQKLLQATSGQAGMAIGQYLRDHFRPA